MTIDTDRREHYVIGDGVTAIQGGRDLVIGWPPGTTVNCARDRPGPLAGPLHSSEESNRRRRSTV